MTSWQQVLQDVPGAEGITPAEDAEVLAFVDRDDPLPVSDPELLVRLWAVAAPRARRQLTALAAGFTAELDRMETKATSAARVRAHPSTTHGPARRVWHQVVGIFLAALAPAALLPMTRGAITYPNDLLDLAPVVAVLYPAALAWHVWLEWPRRPLAFPPWLHWLFAAWLGTGVVVTLTRSELTLPGEPAVLAWLAAVTLGWCVLALVTRGRGGPAGYGGDDRPAPHVDEARIWEAEEHLLADARNVLARLPGGERVRTRSATVAGIAALHRRGRLEPTRSRTLLENLLGPEAAPEQD